MKNASLLSEYKSGSIKSLHKPGLLVIDGVETETCVNVGFDVRISCVLGNVLHPISCPQQ